MSISIKQAAFLAMFLLIGSLLFVYFQGAPESVTGTKDKVLSTFSILNSERYAQDPKTNHLAQDNGNTQLNLNTKKHTPAPMTHKQYDTHASHTQASHDSSDTHTGSDEKDVNEDWLLKALSSDKDGASASYFENSNLFGTYDFSSKTPAVANQNRDSHLQERAYFDYLALVLMKYQYIHNNLETVKTQQAWFDKKDEAGRSSLKQEAQDYIKISKELGKLHPPVTVSGLNGRIARAYALAGEKMLNLTKNMSTKELQNALLDYNQAAGQVTKALIAVSDYVSLLHIQFAEDEPGRIFVFPGNGKIQR